MKNLNMIVCVAKDNLIGDKNPVGNGMLWHIKEELMYFKEKTLGKTLIFGSNTAKCIPLEKMKSDRKIIVLEYGMDIDKILKDNENEEIFICGGASVYKYFLDNYSFSKIYVSVIKSKVEVKKTKNPVYLPILEDYGYKKRLLKEYENFYAYIYER